MKRLVYIIVFALGLTACYDDKDSYDYHDICEVNIEGWSRFMKRFTGKVCWKSILR